MPLPAPEPGLVICYSYLWHAEYRTGQEEGAKDRPAAIILTMRDAGGDTVVTVVPITHAPPHYPEEAVEIPPATKRRLGLDDAPSWVIASEANRFAWPGPDLRPVSPHHPDGFDYGFLPPSLFRQIRERILACAKAQRLRMVRRDT